MNKQVVVLVEAVEMFFDDADESMLKKISAVWNARGTYDIEASSVTFTMSKLIPKHIEDMPALMEMVDGIGKLQAQQNGCTYKNAKTYMHLADEYTASIVTGKECERIVFSVAKPA